MAIAYSETLPDPTQEHWYDLFGIFSGPGIMLTWAIFNPPDGYYGDIWDNRTHIVLLNGLSWTLLPLMFLVAHKLVDFIYYKVISPRLQRKHQRS